MGFDEKRSQIVSKNSNHPLKSANIKKSTTSSPMLKPKSHSSFIQLDF